MAIDTVQGDHWTFFHNTISHFQALTANLTLDRIAAATSGAEVPAITEHRIRTGWNGNWRASLTYLLAKHNAGALYQ